MRFVLRLLFTCLGVLMFVWMAGATSHAQACSNKSARGIYGYSCSGSVGNVPFAGYGVVAGDGRGHWNGRGKVSFGGDIHTWTHNTRPEHPAVVNGDCTGSVTYEVTVDGYPAPDAHFDFVIVDDGFEVKGFPTDPGYAVTCQLILERDKTQRHGR